MIWKLLNRRQAARLTLPRTFTRDTMYSLIDAMLDPSEDCKHSHVLLDFSRLELIQVGGVATLSNMIEASRKAGVKVAFEGAQLCKAAPFLTGAGFIAQYCGGEAVKTRRGAPHAPLRLVEYSRSANYLLNELVPWLGSILSVEDRALATIKVCFEEIFNNIEDHSTVNVGCSCAYFDKAQKQITICISDIGVGIPRNVRSKMKLGSDQAAIAMACQQGFTTQTTPRNMGAGLHVLITNVVARNGGSVIIHSGSGIYSSVRGSGRSVKKTGRPSRGFYPGTLIYVTLDTSQFVPDEIEEKFEWELSEF